MAVSFSEDAALLLAKHEMKSSANATFRQPSAMGTLFDTAFHLKKELKCVSKFGKCTLNTIDSVTKELRCRPLNLNQHNRFNQPLRLSKSTF